MIRRISTSFGKYISTSNSPSFLNLGSMINNYSYSKAKKQKPQLKMTTINLNKFNEEHNGFILYHNQQGNKIKAITIAFILCFASGYWTYSHIDDDQIKVNYMIIGAILVVPFLIFQFRTAKTLKMLVLDKQGENVILSRFTMGGFSQQNTKTRVQVLRGIGKAFIFGGNVIKGGGMYGLQERNYWFQSKFITERQVFQEIAQGNRIKIETVKNIN